MSVAETTEQVWQSIAGAAPLREAYGHWPTLHDAVVRALNIIYTDRAVELVLDYADVQSHDAVERSIERRITLRWRGVDKAALRLHDGDLYGVKFGRWEGGIETYFDDYTWGLDGFIRSASVEVTRIEPMPDMSGVPQTEPSHHNILLAFR